MMSRSRLLSQGALLGLAFAACAALTAGPVGAQEKKGAVVGMVTELSGPGSLFGEAGLQAAQVALDEVNAAGGVLGGKLELKVADDNTDPNTARQVWEKLVSEKVDAIIFRETSAARVAALPVAEKANIPALYANDYEGGDCRPILYTTGEIEPQKIGPYLKFLKEKSGGSKFFILATDYNWARIMADMVKQAAPGLGIQLIGEEFTPFNTTDYTPLITKIRDAGPDVLFSGLVGGPDNVAFFKQARSSGLMQKVKLLGNIALDDSTLSAVGGAAQGTYMAASYFESIDTPGNKKFLAALKSKYGNDVKSQGYLSEPSYDTVHLYAEAVKKAGTTETSAVLKALTEVSFEGPKGSIHLTADRHAAMPIYIAQANAKGGYEVVDSLGVQQPPRQCNPEPPFGMPK
ncbi:MAG: substrate-binding protein [Hyphomicrobiales bacterium]|nr:substrate-binding protein [Hyphomicrobiales bacterium]